MRKLTAEEIAAMWIYGKEYAESRKNAIEWWRDLSNGRKKDVQRFLSEIAAAIRRGK